MVNKGDKEGFGFLGIEYQKRLVAQLLTDSRFATSLIDVLDANYFTDEHLRILVATIKDSFEESDAMPDFGSLEIRLNNRKDNEISKTFIQEQLNEISTISLNDGEFVQERAMKFCKQQELMKAIRNIEVITETGTLDDYDECEDILKKALDVGSNKDDVVDVFDDLDSVLAEDFRKPIPTGIIGLDSKMNGGLGKRELGVILAPFGVGKTTMITKIANEAYNLGYKVLQIFFEDTPKIIQRKHISCWTNLEINVLGDADKREIINETVKERHKSKGYLKLKPFPSNGTTMVHIKKYIRKLVASGQKPDMILLDYIDCVESSKKFEKSYDAEGAVMRQFETLLSEFDLVGWTAMQGNRSSIGAETVDSSMIGGSIKKGQIGHFVVSIAKTLDQKENGRANMAILKSRFGVDGIIFSDILFDNARIQISIDNENWQTSGEKEKNKDEEGLTKVRELMLAAEKRAKENANESVE